MSPRPHRKRRIQAAPSITGMRPQGGGRYRHGQSAINLMLEEYEALRLCDYQGLNHEDAATEMQVSRPTFTRICTNARKKMATALVEGLEVVVGGGNVNIAKHEYCVCPGCNIKIEHEPGVPCKTRKCPECGAQMVRN